MMPLRLALACGILALTCICAACTTTATSESPSAPAKKFTDAEKAELAEGMYSLMKERCAECHQAGAAKIYAKIDYILDHDKLIASRWVKLDAPETSGLYTECEEGSMPRKFNAEGKPKIKDPLAKEKVDLILNWLKAGAPKWLAK